jgi:hypothetical protein
MIAASNYARALDIIWKNIGFMVTDQRLEAQKGGLKCAVFETFRHINVNLPHDSWWL